MAMRVEICANSVESAVKAQKGGAFRVELCAGIPEGGTTPSYGEILAARKHLVTTRLHVIIRPRGGDFYYSNLEQEIMLNDIRICNEIGVDGIVVGCLTKEGDVDKVVMQKMMKASGKMDVTFHRAFDMCRNPFYALEDIINLGCSRLLSSGQMSTAEEGVEVLKKMVEHAKDRIVIMPGCGVRPDNIRKIADLTGASEFHLSARGSVMSEMIYRNPNVSMGGTVIIDEYTRQLTDEKIVRAAIAALAK